MAHDDLDSRVPCGRLLEAFADALVDGSDDDVRAARGALVEAVGAAATVRAAAVVGNFEMMNRLVDATGVPVGAGLATMAAALDVPWPPSRATSG